MGVDTGGWLAGLNNALPPAEPFDEPWECDLRAAIDYVVEEIGEVQSGRATTLDVLADEIAHLRSLLHDPHNLSPADCLDPCCDRFRRPDEGAA